MLFNSVSFLIFFSAVVLVYFFMVGRHRWLFLLLASYYFYMSWQPEYIILILLSTTVDYYAGQKMVALTEKSQRKKYLFLSIAANMGLLFTFKYLNFFRDTLISLTASVGLAVSLPTWNIILPIGISFYTFQTLSYTIDVYNGKTSPEGNYGRFALFVAFFPQLVAGPIERPSKLLPQLNQVSLLGNFDYDRVTSGLRLMTWGFFKKLVIADRLAIHVNAVYNHPADHFGLVVVLSTVFFAFQIYCDFSGYSDIAIGAARILGISLSENFRRPYLATNIADFWGRWHISLTSWFRDYIYIPLGGNHVSLGRWHLNVLIVFLLSGLWHGANWTFVIWGLIHATAYLTMHWLGRLTDTMLRRHNVETLPYQNVLHVLCVIIVFTIVCFGWIFFRANSLDDAFLLIRNMFHFVSISSLWDFRLALEGNEFLLAIALIIFLVSVEILQTWVDFQQWIAKQPLLIRFTIYYLAVMSLTLLGVFGDSASEFIYFQF